MGTFNHICLYTDGCSKNKNNPRPGAIGVLICYDTNTLL